MPLDRDLQRRILECCAKHYPHMTNEVLKFASVDDLGTNITYLQEHGLVESSMKISNLRQVAFGGVKATMRGMDFIEADGGLSAVLGVVTIKLHDDTIKALIAQKVQESDLPAAEKSSYLEKLRTLPAEATKHLVLKLIDKGLESGPQAVAVIANWLS